MPKRNGSFLIGLIGILLLGCGDHGNDNDVLRTPTPTPTPTVAPTNTPAAEACSAFYAGKIADPLVKPSGPIAVPPLGVVRFEQVGSAEDVLQAFVNGEPSYTDTTLSLRPGTNTVDFVVTGEGEVHNWHVRFTVGNTVVFEQQQGTLEPAYVCAGEMYRVRLIFEVG